VLVINGGMALVRFAEGRAELEFVSPAAAPPGVRFLLGVDPAGIAYFGVDTPLDQVAPDGSRAPDGASVRRPHCARWARCSGTATPACSRTPSRSPTGTTHTPTARSAVRRPR